MDCLASFIELNYTWSKHRANRGLFLANRGLDAAFKLHYCLQTSGSVPIALTFSPASQVGSFNFKIKETL